MRNLEIGATYKHYKGKLYRVICEARHSETSEDLVIYQKLYDDFAFWARPKQNFLENVILLGEKVERFKKVEE